MDLLKPLLAAVSIYSRRPKNNKLNKVAFSHLRNGGALELAKCLQTLGPSGGPQILSLTSCGISNVGVVESILSSLKQSSSLVSLDLSRTSLLQNLDPSIFSELLPTIRNLKELILVGTNLNEPLVDSLFLALRNDSCSVETLDISNNFDSLEGLLECILVHLPFLKCLKRLILARGANSSTCIDYEQQGNDGNDHILVRLEERVRQNKSLQFLGPLALLPLDRESSPAVHAQYHKCQVSLEKIEYSLGWNRLFQTVLAANAATPGKLERPFVEALTTTIQSTSARNGSSVDSQSALPKNVLISLQYSLLRETLDSWT